MSARRVAELIELGLPALEAQHGAHLTPAHYRALHALRHCHDGAFGYADMACPGCGHTEQRMRSCGHRSCPRCQQALASQWLERQQAKLLPVPYFMVTFTVPAQLRPLAYRHPKVFYDALFSAAIGTLKRFARHHKALRAQLGACAILHTHSRRLEYHPHLHVIVPGGGLDVARKQWRKLKGDYLFNAKQLAVVYRAKLIDALHRAGLSWSPAPAQWVVHCKKVGKGLPALKYLSRYLYRGVIAERDIVDFDSSTNRVTFQYQDGKTKTTAHRTLSIADFLWHLMLHVLPTGYRRVREYGLLHANAKRLRALLQLVLHANVPPPHAPAPRTFLCPHCRCAMNLMLCHLPSGRAPPPPSGVAA